MSEAPQDWREALDLAAHLGLLPADRAKRLASSPPADLDATSLATASGLSLPEAESLLRLAPSLRTKATPGHASRGFGSLASDLARIVAEDPPDPGVRPRPVVLTLRTDENPPRKWRFSAPASVLIGRSLNAHVRLDDTHISGSHAVIEVTCVGCRIRDLRSANHTHVNDGRVDARDLQDGDVILVGRTRLRVTVRGVAASTTWIGELPEEPDVPGYHIETRLGGGGQGVVWLAREQAEGNRQVALKTFRAPLLLDERERDRRVKHFLREAMVAPAFRHRHVVELYSAGWANQTVYVAMEYVPGGDLGSFVGPSGRLPWRVACRFVAQALEAMAAAHARKLVHRDLKPENLLLTAASPEGDIKVADLGLAKNFTLAGLSGFTATGICAGTIEYMPPEQFLDYKYVSPPSDVYSLGAVLFRLLTGRGVHGGALGGVEELLSALEAPVPPVLSIERAVPPTVAAVVDRALLREPALRYDDAGRMLEALRAAMG